MGEKTAILNSLEPLFEKASKENLWFYCSYQGLWFSPKELREYQAGDRFIWGCDNWQLRSPNERIKELETMKDNIDKDIQKIKERAGF